LLFLFEVKVSLAFPIPELKMLLASVESHLDALSQSDEAGIGQMLSASTLKRLWGYVTSKPVP